MKENLVLLRNRDKENMSDAAEYIATGGYKGLARALEMSGWDIIQELKAAGLRGRGGAGVPSWLKLKFAYDAVGDTKYIVCNADEGEPGTNKDRVLMLSDPHSLLEGMAIAGRAIGANRGYIYLRAEYPYVLPVLKQAIDSAKKLNWLGDDIQGSGFSFDISIRLGAGAYVCGEETALFESIEGRRGEPRLRPPYPANQGLFGKPTCLNNVETLANMSHILREGAEWYNTLGVEGSRGTKLFTVSGNVNNRGVYEFDMGINLKELIYDFCGGISDGHKLLAVQTGGASGAIINPDQIDFNLDIDHAAPGGGRLGCGTIFVVDDTNCVLDIVRNNMAFFCSESCGKCVPCREGTRRIFLLIDKICSGKGTVRDLKNIVDLANTIKIAAFCGLGHSSAVPVLSAIENFPDEFNSHLDGDYCACCARLERSVILDA
ncbi:MAG: SLBB domain-containing protein [Oscillospiraceae bacterium]|nr:SLBB domain-containing protein [Oscillospiraceae bacterium]